MSLINAIPNTDPLFTDAARAIVQQQKSSFVFLQLEFSLGSNRAQKILDELVKAKILAPYNPDMEQRDILVPDLAQLEQLLINLICQPQ